jgi:methyl-accepting chemotaxis protein
MKITVGKRIMSGFAVVIILIIALGSLGLLELSSANKRIENIYEKHLKGVQFIEEAKYNIVARGRAEKNMIIASESSEIEKHAGIMKMYSSDFTARLVDFSATVVTEEGKLKLKEIINSWQQVMPLQEKMIAYGNENNDEEAYEVSNQIRDIENKIENDINDLSSQKIELAKVDYEENKAKFNSALTMAIAFIIFASILGIGIGVYISRIISRPLTAMADAASKIAGGDLTVDMIKIKNQDEIGILSGAFNKMASELQNIVKRIASVSQTIASSSEELSASSEETTASAEQVASTVSSLTDKTTKQSYEVINVSSIVNDISANTQQSASNSKAVTDVSMKVLETAKQGVEASKDAVRKIEQVEKSSKRTSEAINLLAMESEKIGQIVDVIAGIAEQTNLLALNAAIEAARAGENGRGFAVVAEEIRTLAEQSSISTKEITELVANIQKETDNARIVINDSGSEVAEGVVAVNNAGKSFEIIVGEVDTVVDQITKVSSAVQHISDSSNEVVKVIENISALAQQNAAFSEEILASSEEQAASMEGISRSSQELAQLATELNETVEKFKYE